MSFEILLDDECLYRRRFTKQPKHVLVCFPYAGAISDTFLGLGESLLPHDVAVVSMRGSWIKSLPEDVRTTRIANVVANLRSIVGTPPISLFGHSLGSLIAFDVACSLRTNEMEVANCFVSAGVPPTGRLDHFDVALADRDFLAAWNRRIQGIPSYVFDSPELITLIAKQLKHDLALFSRYQLRSFRPIDIPLIAIRGASDEMASASEVNEWSRLTVSSFECYEIRGDHFYIIHDVSEVGRIITNRCLHDDRTIAYN